MRTCGMVRRCSSCGASSRIIRNHPKGSSYDCQVRLWEGPKLPRSSLKHPAKAAADMWSGPNCSSLTCRSYSCCAQVGWPRLTQAWPVEATCAGGPELLKANLSIYLPMLRKYPSNPAKTVADMWDCPKLLKSKLSKLLVLHTHVCWP